MASNGGRGLLERLRRRLTGVVLAVAASLALMSMVGVTPCRAAAELPFPRPVFIEPNVRFWVDVFTTYSIRDFALVDRDKVSRVYQVFHLPGYGIPTREDVD